MDVFLGSRGLGALLPWLDELAHRPRRALLVPTAGNPLPATPWVGVTERALAAAGLSVRRLDLEPATPDEVAGAVAAADLLFVTGGFPIFLLQHAQRTGFLHAVRQRAGALAYAGMSAGAALAAPDLAFHHGDDDPGRVPDTTGLGLVPFYPLAHAGPGREERYARLIDRFGDRYDFVPIRDDQAVLVRDDSREIRPS